MNGETMIDHEAKVVRMSFEQREIGDAGRAMERIRHAARACWPDIMFNDEALDEERQECQSFATPDPGPAEPQRALAAPESPSAADLRPKIREFCEAEATCDPSQVAEAFALTKQRAGAILHAMRKAGELKEIDACD